MHLSARVLGKHAVDQLSARASGALLVIGASRFTRGDLARVGCYNYVAAANLSRAIETHFHVTSIRDLFDTVAPGELILPHVGTVAFAVLGAAFELGHVGGDAPLEAWINHHRPKDYQGRDYVTIDTLKARRADADPPPSRARRRRPAPPPKGPRGRAPGHRYRLTRHPVTTAHDTKE